LQQCKKAGFEAGPHETRKKRNGNRLGSFSIYCKHRHYLRKNETAKYRTTRACNKESQCPFQIRIFCDVEDECWYLSSTYHESCKPCLHNRHPFILPNLLISSSQEINEKDIELALQCSELCPTDAMSTKL